ncbi:MAG: hypothetical protein K1X85_02975 [Ignavibacteria bacterium]|nr:hypothetical protein [Ignavibacteria bacterium]
MAGINLDSLGSETQERNYLYKVLSTFSDEEWVEFEKFAASPYFNRGRNFGVLMKILKKHRPGFESPELRKRDLYRRLYPGKAYKESVMYSTFSRLGNLAEDFMIQKEYEKDEKLNRDWARMTAYARRNLPRKGPALIKKLSDRLNSGKITVRHYFDAKEVAKEVASYFYLFDQRHKLPENIHEVLKNSLYWHVTESSMFLNSLFSQKTFDKAEYDASLYKELRECFDFEKFLGILKVKDKKNYTLMLIQYLNVEANLHPLRDEPYFALKELVFSGLASFDRDFKEYLLDRLAELCSLRVLAGNSKFNKEVFEIRKKLVEEDLYSDGENRTIRLSKFRTTFIEALNLREIEWAEMFFRRYIHKLNPAVMEDVRLYCEARLCYERNDPDRAIELAVKANIDQVFFKLDLKNLLAKAYYDTSSVESLYSLLSTYYQFIRNSGKSKENFFKRHANFVKYMKKLAAVRFGVNNSEDVGLLLKELAKANVSAKSWLIDRFRQLK